MKKTTWKAKEKRKAVHLPVADGAHGHDNGRIVLVLLLQMVPSTVVGVDVPQPSEVLEWGDQGLQLTVLVVLLLKCVCVRCEFNEIWWVMMSNDEQRATQYHKTKLHTMDKFRTYKQIKPKTRSTFTYTRRFYYTYLGFFLFFFLLLLLQGLSFLVLHRNLSYRKIGAYYE